MTPSDLTPLLAAILPTAAVVYGYIRSGRKNTAEAENIVADTLGEIITALRVEIGHYRADAKELRAEVGGLRDELKKAVNNNMALAIENEALGKKVEKLRKRIVILEDELRRQGLGVPTDEGGA